MTKPGNDPIDENRHAAGPTPQPGEQQILELLEEIHELEQFRREQLTLRKLSSFLKSSLTTAEALSAVKYFGPELWPAATGSVYLLHEAGGHLECAKTWGSATSTGHSLEWQDCWALRNLQPHCVLEDDTGLQCRHLSQGPAALPSICVPLIAQGQMLGLLHLQQLRKIPDKFRNKQAIDAALSLATMVAEELSLAHSNVRLRESLREQSVRDALTGLFNRRFIDEFLVRELARAERKARQLSMIALDIDHFKRINDSFGHGAGDRVLQEVGTILQAHVRSSDVASRIGGEEFLLLLAESPLTLAVRRAEDIRSAIHDMSLQYENKALGRITASFGTVAFPDHGRTAEQLMSAADKALYAAKNAGRNLVVSGTSRIQ